ncbi:metallophosphoesterase [Paracoccus sp. (in: a-proteobacteria)]|uniref:metallophosphoesterase n=1 Tax=Paracoccus sp. TaxID=267 RepID=UPI0032201261
MYNVIPDIHADPARLEGSLQAVGSGQLAFLGDFIDAGKKVSHPDDRTVLTRVRGLVEAGAKAVMGNHELNAILFHHPDRLRAHSEKNRAQHRSFIETFGIATPEAREWTDWFLTLPLWLDLGGLRLVHACWSQPDIDLIAARRPDGRLRPEDLPEIARESTPFGRAVKTLTSGPEVSLPAGYAFSDFGGHRRTEMRVAWWRSRAATWREAALSVPDPLLLPEEALPSGILAEIYSSDAPPVLVGHYKMTGEPLIEGSAACLDYPSEPLAYCWQGEKQLSKDNLIRL